MTYSQPQLFTRETQAIFWNMNPAAIQRMLDYDYTIGRDTPSIAAIVAPTGNTKFEKFFWGNGEILLPLYKDTATAQKKHPNADVLINFASFRSAPAVAKEAIQIGGFRVIMITAEGIPERHAREINALAREQDITVIGPATLGAITPGAFKIANVGGTIDNIVSSGLHRAGSCGLVTRSGGLFNEISTILSQHADGVAEGIALGGDRYVGSTFIDNLLRMEKNPRVKYMMVLGEVGGTDEYEIIKAVEDGRLQKPIIAWCIGTIATAFSSGVQFGHAGAAANQEKETAQAKHIAMKKAGIHVPQSFNDLPQLINTVYMQLQNDGQIESIEEPAVPTISEDRKKTQFICTISDDRGEEAAYAGVPISQLATPDTGKGIADVISLLWFKKQYPQWATDFMETVLKTVADHGPAVSGAHNAKVTARAGKSVVESLVTGLLTIGPRFGGAIDGAAHYFKYGADNGLSPEEFMKYMKTEGIRIPGIGHRVKSVSNPDLRVEGLKAYATEHFPATPVLDYALEVEKVSTAKKENLILNVDGAIGALMVDMWRALEYTEEEIEEFIETGTLNAFFILGRSIGFIGHILDEKRLGMPMYRHPTDDILYDVPEAEEL